MSPRDRQVSEKGRCSSEKGPGHREDPRADGDPGIERL